jgi:AmiR/NasT family two-component response regulator
MAQQRCSPDEAFNLLRAVSQRRNIKLREVAANLVATVQSTS